MSTENHRILEKSMRMLEVVSNHPEGISLTDICAEVNVAKGSAHSLLTTLVNMGYLRRDPRTSLYTVSLKTFEVGARFVENNRHFRYAREVLENLVASIRQTAHMAVLDGTDVIYIHKVDCSHAIRMVPSSGGAFRRTRRPSARRCWRIIPTRRCALSTRENRWPA